MTNRRNNDNELQSNNQQNNYFTDSQVITGNVFSGDQRQVRRSTQWDHVPSAQELRNEARDMLNQARQLPNAGLLEQRNYDTGNSSALVRSQQNDIANTLRNTRVPLYDNQGRQITDLAEIRAEVARREAEWAANHGGRPEFSDFELGPTIGPMHIPLYDKHGRLITDQRAIEAEIARREAEWRQWEREGKIQNSRQRTVVNQDGTFTVSFRGLESSIREIDNSSSRFEEITGISSSHSNQRQTENQNEIEESRRQSREAERNRRETESQARTQQQENKPLFLYRRK